MALLKTVGLCKYFGGLKAVNHVDMEVQQGQVFGIIGPNAVSYTHLDVYKRQQPGQCLYI